ncbi:MAG: alpha-E domain-containing protein [Bacteroidota bacterium]
MLARVANNLFWMGRYLERSEHLARYMNVNYFSSLDAPSAISQSRQFVLRSLLFMLGTPEQDAGKTLQEEEILYNIGLNPTYDHAILNNVKAIRENANGARDLISTELYESINRFYHFVLNYDVDYFVKRGLYDFTIGVTQRTAILRGKIRGTLLHDEIYSIIMMGVNIERATQVIRMINAKYQDALTAKGSYGDQVGNSFEWTTLLRCAESYDMMRRYYRKTPTVLSALEFLVLNGDCPRSVMNSLNQVCKHMDNLHLDQPPNKDSTSFLAGKLRAEFQYLRVEDIEKDINGFIQKILERLYQISNSMEKEFFQY